MKGYRDVTVQIREDLFKWSDGFKKGELCIVCSDIIELQRTKRIFIYSEFGFPAKEIGGLKGTDVTISGPFCSNDCVAEWSLR